MPRAPVASLPDVALHRLHNQQLSHQSFRRPEDVVEWMGAVQGQEYEPGKWAIGLRTRDTTAAEIERAVAEARIVRTWPMRGTIHFVAAKDIRWMLDLLAPRVIKKFTSYYRREKLDPTTFAKSKRIIVDHLRGGKVLTRPALYAVLEKAGIRTQNVRGLFIVGRLAMEGVLCFGPKEGNQPTFTLLDEWASDAPSMGPQEALRELGRRYFTSHGPATIYDLAWWAGLKVAEARRAVDLAKDELVDARIGDRVYWMAKGLPDTSTVHAGTYLLPTYDEFLIGYQDRGAAVEPGAPRPDNLFTATIVSEGRVIGFWRRTTNKGTVDITTRLFGAPTRARWKAIREAAKRFGDFSGLRVAIS